MTYGPISATFITGRSQIEKTFFGRWQSLTVNKATWEPRYYEDYIGGLRIWHLDERNNDRDGVEIFEAFPKLINAQDVGHAQGNAYQTLTVEFTFHHWYAIKAQRVSKPETTPTKGDPDRAPLEQTKHGFMARNYKSSSIIRNPHADR